MSTHMSIHITILCGLMLHDALHRANRLRSLVHPDIQQRNLCADVCVAMCTDVRIGMCTDMCMDV